MEVFKNVKGLESNINVPLQLCQKQLSAPYAQQSAITKMNDPQQCYKSDFKIFLFVAQEFSSD